MLVRLNCVDRDVSCRVWLALRRCFTDKRREQFRPALEDCYSGLLLAPRTEARAQCRRCVPPCQRSLHSSPAFRPEDCALPPPQEDFWDAAAPAAELMGTIVGPSFSARSAALGCEAVHDGPRWAGRMRPCGPGAACLPAPCAGERSCAHRRRACALGWPAAGRFRAAPTGNGSSRRLRAAR